MAAAAFCLATALASSIAPASSHNPVVAGESPGNPLGLVGVPFRGPDGTTIEDRACPPIPDHLATSYDDDETYQIPPGWGHIGHINGVNGPGAVTSNYIAVGSVDLYHFENALYNNPTAIEGPHPVNVVEYSVMMGPDGFFRGRMQETIRDEPGTDLRVTDVHERRTYCIYGALEHDGPFLFIGSTFNDPALTQTTDLDLEVFYAPLFQATYPDDDEPRMDYVFLVTSAFQDADQNFYTAPDASFSYESHPVCGNAAIVFSANVSDADGQVVSVEWNFGDGGQAYGTTAQHVFATTQAHTVTVTVEDNDGLITVATQEVYGVASPNCCPALDVPIIIRAAEGATIGFAALGSDFDLDPLTYTLLPFHANASLTPAGLFDWDTAVGDAGWYTAVIEVTDGQCAVQRPVRIGVAAEGHHEAVEDRDWDSIEDGADNCPGIRNREQQDSDLDGIGDACEEGGASPGQEPGASNAASPRRDADGDGVPDAADVCPAVPDTGQNDLDADGAGDACDIDADGDLVPEQGTAGLFLDNCPFKANAGQADRDGDAIGDACDDAVMQAAPVGPGGALSGAPTAAPTGPWGLWLALAGVAACVVVAGAAFVALRRPRG